MIILLDELRVRAQNHKTKVDSDPASTEKQKSDAAMYVKFFSNQDYINGSKKFTVIFIMYCLEYEMRELDALYDRLMEEVNRTYPGCQLGAACRNPAGKGHLA